ncbi:unnamed protein product [Dicrocoelium dendriticum]|nr:unnamed protein product [Dicrocoelium dendriticum]
MTRIVIILAMLMVAAQTNRENPKEYVYCNKECKADANAAVAACEKEPGSKHCIQLLYIYNTCVNMCVLKASEMNKVAIYEENQNNETEHV